LDTMGTVEMLRSSLGELPTKIVELSGNIVDFHQHVNTILNALDSYGQVYPELIINLFKSYKMIEDKEFATFIMITRYGYIANPIAYDPRTLMEGVENDYKIRVESGTWSPNLEKKEMAEITALKAEIVALKATTGSSNKNNDEAAKRKAEKNAWKKVPPSEGDPKVCKFEDRTYYWCGNHKMWTMHKEEECKGRDYRPNRNNNSGNTGGNNTGSPAPQAMAAAVVANNTTNPNVRVNEAMQTIVEYSGFSD
jgi:hypothetical protein